MNPLCYELLSGTLEQPSSPTLISGQIVNSLPVPITVILPPGSDDARKTIAGYGSIGVDDAASGNWPVTVAATGSLVTVVNVPPPTPYTVTVANSMLSAPNDIGPIPVPSYSPTAGAGIFPSGTRVTGSTILLPPDSPRVLVACGVAPNGNIITREQYWERQADSVCLAGGEKRTVSFTTFQGKQQTSSETHDVSASLSSDISGGWGAISASISASLSVNSTSFQQLTVTEQTTSYVSHTVHNTHEVPIMYLRWQLMDVITVFAPTMSGETITSLLPKSSVVMAESPIVVMGPYWITAPPRVGSETTAPDASALGLFTYT